MVRPEWSWDSPGRLEKVVAGVELLGRYLARRRFEGEAIQGAGDCPRVLWIDELSPAQKDEWAALLRDEAARDRRSFQIRDEYLEAAS